MHAIITCTQESQGWLYCLSQAPVYLMPQYCTKLQRSGLNMPIQVPIILISSKMLAYYSRIILYAFRYLLFSKLCWHNLSRPSLMHTL